MGDKLIISVRVDANVDITGLEDAALIRERMFSKVGIPDDERGHYSVYRTEHGEQAMEDLISDDQLMIYCEALANAKGTLKFLFQRDREGRSQDVPTLPPALLASSSVAEVGPPTLTISPLLGASIRRPPYSQQHLETETGTHERKQTLQAVERHPDNQAKDLKSRLRKDIRYVAEERKKVLEKINAAQEASPNAAFLHGGAAPNCGARANRRLTRAGDQSPTTSTPEDWIQDTRMSDTTFNHAALERTLRALERFRIDPSRITRAPRTSRVAGGYGDVWFGTLDEGTPGSMLVAVKELRPTGSDNERARIAFSLARELKVWAKFEHPNVLRLIGFCLDHDMTTATLISPFQAYGHIADYIQKNDLDEMTRLELALDTAEGLAYLHGLDPSVCHGDLKARNVLVKDNFHAVLCDFGLTLVAEEAGTTGLTTSKSLRGTLRHLSPELLQEDIPRRTLLSDVWAWGCLLLEILLNTLPYANLTRDPVIIRNLVLGIPPADTQTLNVPSRVKTLLERCWKIQPSSRPTIKECREELRTCLHSNSGLTHYVRQRPGPLLPSSYDVTSGGAIPGELDRHVYPTANSESPLLPSVGPEPTPRIYPQSSIRQERTRESDYNIPILLTTPTTISPRSRTGRGLHAALPPGAVDPRMRRETERQKQVLGAAAPSPSQFHSSPVPSFTHFQQQPSYISPPQSTPISPPAIRVLQPARHDTGPKLPRSLSDLRHFGPTSPTAAGTTGFSISSQKPTSLPLTTFLNDNYGVSRVPQSPNRLPAPSPNRPITSPSTFHNGGPASSVRILNAPLDHTTSGTPRSLGSSGSATGPFSAGISADTPLGVDRSYDRMNNALDRTMVAQRNNGSQMLNRDNIPAPGSSSSYRYGWLPSTNSPAPSQPHSGDVENGLPPIENHLHEHTLPVPTNLGSRQEELPDQDRSEESDEEYSSEEGDDRFWNTFTTPKPATLKWTRVGLLGKGTNTKLYAARSITTGEMLAVKQAEIHRTRSEQDDARQVTTLNSLKAERNALEQLDHPNIVHCFGFEETPNFFSVFLEYIPSGSVGGCLRKHGKFEEQTVKSFTGQIVNGLAYLHDSKIIHRDIKADNILVDPKGICKISDFGTSIRNDDVYTNNATMTEMEGSIFWMAPEMVYNKKKGYSAKVDIWSLGCVFIEMFAGRRPWEHDDFVSVIFKMGVDRMAPPVPEDVTMTPGADHFRLRCFTQDPDERPTAEALKAHPWPVPQQGWLFTGFR